MRRTVALLALFVIAAIAEAEDPHVAKRELVRELLKVLDGKGLTQTMLTAALTRFESSPLPPEVAATLSADDRKQYEDMLASQAEAAKQFRDQLFARIDYATYTEDVFAPVFDETFSEAELQQLIVFFKTPAGQKTARAFADLAASSVRHDGKIAEIARTMLEEKPPRKPAEKYEQTMADLRAVATAAEAYATDNNKYPNVNAYADLKNILSPTYIKELPEKDAWGTPFLYVVSPDRQQYRFVSAGADQRFEWNVHSIEAIGDDFKPREMDNLDADIVYQDGVFVQFPAVAKESIY